MRILQPGTWPLDPVYGATCHRCKTVVEFAESEGTVVIDPRDGDYVEAECPVCEGPLRVAKKGEKPCGS